MFFIVICFQSPFAFASLRPDILSAWDNQLHSLSVLTPVYLCFWTTHTHTHTSDAGELTHKTEHGSSLRLWSGRSCYFSLAFCADVPIHPLKHTYFTRRWCLSDLSLHIRVAGHDVSIILYRMGNFHCVWGKDWQFIQCSGAEHELWLCFHTCMRWSWSLVGLKRQKKSIFFRVMTFYTSIFGGGYQLFHKSTLLYIPAPNGSRQN